MSDHPARYSALFLLNGRDVTICLGAFCEAFDALGWQLVKVTSGNEVSAYVTAEPPETKAANIFITLKDNSTLLVEFAAAELLFTGQQLEQLCNDLFKLVETTLDTSLEVELRGRYMRRLQQSDFDRVKQQKTGLISLLHKVLFTNHPAQMVALLIVVNVLYFVVMVIAGAGIINTDVEMAIAWGAADKYHVVTGEYWRLFTACFIHFGIEHLLANMLGLVYASVFLMLVLSRWQFLLGYIATGIVSMAVSTWWYSDSVSAGASGAIFGCYGMLLGLVFTRIFTRGDRIAIVIYLLIFAGINLLYSFKDGVDAAAHIGGLLSGVVIGLIYYFPLQYKSTWLQPLALGVVVIFGLVCSAFLIGHTQYYGIKFQDLENRYTDLEHDALEYYRAGDTLPQVQQVLLQKGIARFESALLVSDTMKNLSGKPDEIEQYAERLNVYTGYRLYELKLRNKAYLSGSGQWNDSIELLSHKVDSMLGLFR